MKKIIISLLVVVFIIFGIVSSSIYLTDFDKIYTQFASASKIQLTDKNKFNYTVKKFPSLVLVVDELQQPGKVDLKDIQIKFSLWSILKFDHQISDITIDEAKIYLSHDDVKFLNHDEFISELIGKEALYISTKIKKLSFIESDHDIPLIIENFYFAGGDKVTSFNGDVNSLGKLKGQFTKNENVITFNLDVSGATHDIKLQETYENALLKNGTMEIVTSNLVQKLTNLVPDLANISDKLDSGEKIKITLDIIPSDNFLNFKNIVIGSKSIEGNGEILISKTATDASNISLNFNRIDFESLRETKKVTDDKKLLYSASNSKFDFGKHQMKADIFAKMIKLDANSILTDMNFKSLIQDDYLKIEDFSATIRPVGSESEETGKFKLSGVASQNSFRSLFVGAVSLTHNDLNDLVEMIGDKDLRSPNKIPYTLVSDVKFSSVDISMQNLLVKTPYTEISGSFSTKFISNSPRSNAALKFTKMNLDDKNFPALNQIYNYAVSLTEGSKKEDYINKFISLRTINAISSYDISFDELVLHDTTYKNVNLNLGFSPGRARLENLTLGYGGGNYIDMSVDLLASGIKPSFSVVINSGVLEIDFLKPSALLALRNEILENYALDKVDLFMSFAINKLYKDNLSLERVVFKAKNNKSLLEVINFDADIFGGRMLSSGSILVEPFTYNFVYALNSLSVREIAKLFPNGMIDSGGAISLSGMWSTNGKTLEEQLYNLYTKATLVAKDITINNFSIDSLVQAASAQNYNTNNFKDDLKKSLLTGKSDISDLKSSIELTKGVVTLGQMAFKTKYTAGSAAANFNIYDLNLNLSSIFSFYLAKPTNGRSYTDYSPIKLGVKAAGNIFTLKKEADSKELEEGLESVKVK